MHSSKADWVLGDARLISSPSTMLAKIAPGLNSKSRCSWLNTFTPVTSVGSRSGVNCSRRKEQSIERAMALASIVLPTPGTSSINRCPSATRATRARRISACLPRTTFSTLFSMSWKRWAKRCQSCGRSRTSTITSGATRQSYVTSAPTGPAPFAQDYPCIRTIATARLPGMPRRRRDEGGTRTTDRPRPRTPRAAPIRNSRHRARPIRRLAQKITPL